MSAIDELANLLESTEVMRRTFQSLKEEPAHLMANICREYQNRGQPVPDHRLHLGGYITEASLKALLGAGMIRQESGGRVSIYAYQPTKKGLEQHERLKADGYY